MNDQELHLPSEVTQADESLLKTYRDEVGKIYVSDISKDDKIEKLKALAVEAQKQALDPNFPNRADAEKVVKLSKVALEDAPFNVTDFGFLDKVVKDAQTQQMAAAPQESTPPAVTEVKASETTPEPKWTNPEDLLFLIKYQLDPAKRRQQLQAIRALVKERQDHPDPRDIYRYKLPGFLQRINQELGLPPESLPGIPETQPSPVVFAPAEPVEVKPSGEPNASATPTTQHEIPTTFATPPEPEIKFGVPAAHVHAEPLAEPVPVPEASVRPAETATSVITDKLDPENKSQLIPADLVKLKDLVDNYQSRDENDAKTMLGYFLYSAGSPVGYETTLEERVEAARRYLESLKAQPATPEPTQLQESEIDIALKQLAELASFRQDTMAQGDLLNDVLFEIANALHRAGISSEPVESNKRPSISEISKTLYQALSELSQKHKNYEQSAWTPEQLSLVGNLLQNEKVKIFLKGPDRQYLLRIQGQLEQAPEKKLSLTEATDLVEIIKSLGQEYHLAFGINAQDLVNMAPTDLETILFALEQSLRNPNDRAIQEGLALAIRTLLKQAGPIPVVREAQPAADATGVAQTPLETTAGEAPSEEKKRWPNSVSGLKTWFGISSRQKAKQPSEAQTRESNVPSEEDTSKEKRRGLGKKLWVDEAANWAEGMINRIVLGSEKSSRTARPADVVPDPDAAPQTQPGQATQPNERPPQAGEPQGPEIVSRRGGTPAGEATTSTEPPAPSNENQPAEETPPQSIEDILKSL